MSIEDRVAARRCYILPPVLLDEPASSRRILQSLTDGPADLTDLLCFHRDTHAVEREPETAHAVCHLTVVDDRRTA